MTKFQFKGPLWKWQGDGPASWHFVTLPFDVTDEIDEICAEATRGFGSVRVEATIGRTTWTTSVFPSKEQQSFILPVKAPVRRAEGLGDGGTTHVTLRLVDFP